MSENIQELQEQQKAAQEVNMLYFNVKSFATNLVILLLLVTFTAAAHRFFVIKRTKIKGFHFLQSKKILITTFDQFARTVWATLVFVGLGFGERENFVNKFGLEIFNFINFEVKLLLVCGFYFAFISVQSLCYFIAYGRKVNYLDFLVGDFHFDHYVGLMTFFAVVFACSLHLAVALLRRDCRATALRVLLARVNAAAGHYPFVKNLVFFSKPDRAVRRGQLEAELAAALGVPKSNFLLLLFPKMKNICKRQLQINHLTDNYYYWTSPKNPARFFLPDPGAMTARYFAALEQLKEELAREFRKPLSHSGRGLLLFYDFSDIERLHALRRAPGGRLMREHKFYFLCSYNDLLLPNVDKFVHSYRVVRILLYAILALVLLFVTTPLGILETLVRLGLSGGQVEERLLARVFRNEYGRYLLESLFPLLTYLINLLLIVAIEVTGAGQKFARHSFYQEFIFRTSFIYLLINMMVMPAMLFGGSLSLFEFLARAEFSFAALSFNIRQYETGNFFTNIILQSGTFGFISALLMVGPLLRRRGSYDYVQRQLRASRADSYRKEVEDLFEFGYNYSYDCAVFYIVLVFGLYQPLIIFAGALYFLLKAFANVGALTGFFKEQVYMKTRMIDMALRRLRFAVPLMFAVLALKCLQVGKWHFGLLNALFGAAGLAVALFAEGKSFHVGDLLAASRFERGYVNGLAEFRSLYSRNDENYRQTFLEKIVDQVLLDRIASKGSFYGETKLS